MIHAYSDPHGDIVSVVFPRGDGAYEVWTRADVWVNLEKAVEDARSRADHGHLDVEGVGRCPDCGGAVAYNDGIKAYQHIEDPQVGCFLIPAQRVPWEPIPEPEGWHERPDAPAA